MTIGLLRSEKPAHNKALLQYQQRRRPYGRRLPRRAVWIWLTPPTSPPTPWRRWACPWISSAAIATEDASFKSIQLFNQYSFSKHTLQRFLQKAMPNAVMFSLPSLRRCSSYRLLLICSIAASQALSIRRARPLLSASDSPS